MKKFISGAIFGVCITLAVPAFAETATSINVVLDRVKLMVNGEMTNTSTIVYEGKTYVQLRDASDAFGAELKWDGSTNTANLITKEETKGETKEETKEVVKDYLIGENIVFENGTEVKITKAYVAYSFKVDESTYTVPEGQKRVLVEAEILSKQAPVNGRLLSKSAYSNGLVTDDGISYRNYTTDSTLKNEFPPNVRTTKVGFVFYVPDDELIDHIIIEDGANKNTANVKLNLK